MILNNTSIHIKNSIFKIKKDKYCKYHILNLLGHPQAISPWKLIGGLIASAQMVFGEVVQAAGKERLGARTMIRGVVQINQWGASELTRWFHTPPALTVASQRNRSTAATLATKLKTAQDKTSRDTRSSKRHSEVTVGTSTAKATRQMRNNSLADPAIHGTASGWQSAAEAKVANHAPSRPKSRWRDPRFTTCTTVQTNTARSDAKIMTEWRFGKWSYWHRQSKLRNVNLGAFFNQWNQRAVDYTTGRIGCKLFYDASWTSFWPNFHQLYL